MTWSFCLMTIYTVYIVYYCVTVIVTMLTFVGCCWQDDLVRNYLVMCLILVVMRAISCTVLYMRSRKREWSSHSSTCNEIQIRNWPLQYSISSIYQHVLHSVLCRRIQSFVLTTTGGFVDIHSPGRPIDVEAVLLYSCTQTFGVQGAFVRLFHFGFIASLKF